MGRRARWDAAIHSKPNLTARLGSAVDGRPFPSAAGAAAASVTEVVTDRPLTCAAAADRTGSAPSRVVGISLLTARPCLPVPWTLLRQWSVRVTVRPPRWFSS
jgi:hypothetical protein